MGFCYDEKSLIKDGKRILPIMGEFHFSRYDNKAWKEEILKMKAGGIGIVATYVFWIHHEEIENEFDFSGCRDIREFLSICKKTGMSVWLRIGPWAHGECRNGGFPDWLLKKGINLRTNNEAYLQYVDRFFENLSKECKGMMIGEGGPIIGVQIENEYGHCGGPTDRVEGIKHLKKLKEMAIQKGFVTPYYTVTGWGGAHILEEETLPVLGGYVDAPWEQSIEELSASENFLFSGIKNDEKIGSDQVVDGGSGLMYDTKKYPYLTAELGGGLQVTSHRRTFIYKQDTLANTICFLGGGASLLGYYMYHGGINPDGKLTMFNESEASGGFCELPEKNYDFQAPIGSAGQIHHNFHELKKLHMCLRDFGEEILNCKIVFPKEVPENAEDLHTLRYAIAKGKNEEAFIFINNHVRKREMDAHLDVMIEKSKHIDIYNHDIKIIPNMLSIGTDILTDTNASLLCRIKDSVFLYSDQNNAYANWKKNQGCAVILTEKEAFHAFKYKDKLYIVEYDDSILLDEEQQILLLTRHEKETITIYDEEGKKEIIEAINKITPKIQVTCTLEKKFDRKYKEYRIDLLYDQSLDGINQIYMKLDFIGDRAQLFQNGKLVDDWFASGAEWLVGLREQGYTNSFTLKVYDFDNIIPYTRVKGTYYDIEPEKGCELKKVEMIPEYIHFLKKTCDKQDK